MNEIIESHPKWNYEEFLSFLLLYSAHADMEYDESERKFILQRVDPDHLEKVREEFEKLNDYEIIRVIERYRGLYFPTSDRKQELLSRIETLFKADGEYNVVEKNVFRLLKKIL